MKKLIALITVLIIALSVGMVGCTVNNRNVIINSDASDSSSDTASNTSSDSVKTSDPSEGGGSAVIEKITVSVEGGTGGGEYEKGQSVSVKAAVPEGKEFVKWTKNGVDVSVDDPYVFIAEADVSLIAVFADKNPEADALSKVIVVSDVHIAAERVFPNCKERLKNTLIYARDNDIDAVIFNGDTVNATTNENYGYLDDVFTEVFGSVPMEERPEFIFNMGNHEFYPTDHCASEQSQDYDALFNTFANFAQKWSGRAITDNVYVREVAGVNYVVAFPSADNYHYADRDIYHRSGELFAAQGTKIYDAAGGSFSAGDVSKIKAAFDGIIASGSDKPIVFCTHWHLGETYGGSKWGLTGETSNMFYDLLEDYPQVIQLTGHTHFTALHERAFDQGDWTTINVGAFADGDYVTKTDKDENGALIDYVNVDGSRFGTNDLDSKNLDATRTHYFGLFFAYGEEELVISRIDLSDGSVYAHGNWNIPYGITENNKHDKFYYEDGERSGEELHFAADANVRLEVVNGIAKNVSFKDVTEYWAVEGYEIVIADQNGTELKKFKWLSHFWAGLGERSTYNIELKDIPQKEGYTVRIRAIDFFGSYSAAIGENAEIVYTTDAHPDKELFPKGQSKSIYAEQLDAYDTVTFYYKVIDGTTFGVAIIGEDRGTNYYGYITFDENGTSGSYSGVTCEKQSDGYVFVTMYLPEVTKTNGSAPSTVKEFFIRGAYSSANVYVDGVTFKISAQPAEKYTVTVIGGTGSGEYEKDSSVSIKPIVPSGKKFVKWTEDGSDLSTDETYVFTAEKNVTITAVFEDSGEQTDDNVKILVVSDVHVSDNSTSTAHLKKTLQYAVENGIEAIIFNGDTVNISEDAVYTCLDNAFTEVFGSPSAEGIPELIFNMGNHEFYPSDKCAHEETVYDREVAKFKAFAEKWGATIEDNVFVRDINGVKCVIAFPSDERCTTATKDIVIAGETVRLQGETVYYAATGGYSQADVNKVKALFDEILLTGYDKPIVFCTHHPLGETYGSTLYGMSADSESWFKEMLKDYPQIVHLAGHTHFSSIHDRSFVQNDWTSIQIGMHGTGKYVSSVDKDENGENLAYDNITGKRYNSSDAAAQAYNGQTHFGILLTFDSEKMTAERIDLSVGEVYPHGSYVVPNGITKANKSEKFYYEQGERTGETLHFGEDTALNAKIVNGTLTEISFKDVDEYWACEGYEIVIGDKDGNMLKRILWASHFWMGLKEKQTYTIAISDVPQKGEYTVRIRAIDFYGKYSEPYGDTIADEPSSNTHENAELAQAGVNFQRDLSADGNYSTVTFYYKIESGDKFGVAITNTKDMQNYYGYLYFNANGETQDYAGVTCEKQTDGYYFVTINLAEVTVKSGSSPVPDTVGRFYVRGKNNSANVYIDQITFNP